MSRVYRYSVWLYDDACYVQVFINKIYFLFLFGFKFSSNIKKHCLHCLKCQQRTVLDRQEELLHYYFSILNLMCLL